MSEKSVERNKTRNMKWVSILVIVILLPVMLIISRRFGGRKYYISSLIMIMLSMVSFFLSFEKRKPQAREIVTLAVMCAIAVASRAAFVMVPHFKPMTGIIMITAMAFGAEAGFLTGAISGFVSNFLFGQGPWTPWQMFAYGIAGFLAGLLAEKGWIRGDRKLSASVLGAVTVFCIVGPILDTSTLFTVTDEITKEFAAAIYLSGLPVNAVHAAATFVTVFLLGRPITEKLDRIKIKYGMMEEDSYEI